MDAVTQPARPPGPRPGPGPAPDEGRLDELIEAVIAGDEGAWQELAGRMHTMALSICRRRRLGTWRSDAEDLHRDVAARALERIRRDDCAALRRFVTTRARYPQTRFSRWLAVVVTNTFHDHLRARPECQRRRTDAGRELVTANHAPFEEATTAARGHDLGTAVEIRRILAALGEKDFPAVQRRALFYWLSGGAPGEIADLLGLDGPDAANRLLHAARQRLRRRFERSR